MIFFIKKNPSSTINQYKNGKVKPLVDMIILNAMFFIVHRAD